MGFGNVSQTYLTLEPFLPFSILYDKLIQEHILGNIILDVLFQSYLQDLLSPLASQMSKFSNNPLLVPRLSQALVAP